VEGRLYLIGTPIGNLGDITRRAVDVLSSLDVLFCEDTRVTSKLLAHIGARPPTRALSDDSPQALWDEPVRLALEGKRVRFATDAGMPGASDPGRRLCRSAWAAGLIPTIISGPSSIGTLLAACPFVDNAFRFLGFAPRKPGERESFIAAILQSDEPCFFFESVHRVHELLALLCAALEPERQVFIGREMTKLHEQFVLFRAEKWPDIQGSIPQLGEFTLAVSAREPSATRREEEDIRAALKRLEQAGFSKRDAAKALAAVWEISPNEIKRLEYTP
jgi:16S rRNA (cytidine1402-2'-O)-methyltransferase